MSLRGLTFNTEACTRASASWSLDGPDQPQVGAGHVIEGEFPPNPKRTEGLNWASLLGGPNRGVFSQGFLQ